MRKRTILAVDDDQSILMILSDYLSQVGYEVLTANNVASCLEVFNARSKDIDLALLDIKIGPESGFVLADTLEDKFRFHRYVFLTAFFWRRKRLSSCSREASRTSRNRSSSRKRFCLSSNSISAKSKERRDSPFLLTLSVAPDYILR